MQRGIWERKLLINKYNIVFNKTVYKLTDLSDFLSWFLLLQKKGEKYLFRLKITNPNTNTSV